jgi:hypothetical protein
MSGPTIDRSNSNILFSVGFDNRTATPVSAGSRNQIWAHREWRVDADISCMVGPCVNFGIPSMICMVRNAHGRFGMYYHWAKLAKSDRQDVGEPTGDGAACETLPISEASISSIDRFQSKGLDGTARSRGRRTCRPCHGKSRHRRERDPAGRAAGQREWCRGDPPRIHPSKPRRPANTQFTPAAVRTPWCFSAGFCTRGGVPAILGSSIGPAGIRKAHIIIISPSIQVRICWKYDCYLSERRRWSLFWCHVLIGLFNPSRRCARACTAARSL